MSHTPQVIIVTWRKFFHDLFNIASGIAGVVALVSFLVGGNWLFAAVVCVLSAVTASKIKFKLVKKITVDGYDWA